MPLLAAAHIIAHLENARVSESSGLVASRSKQGIYWTHNDSGDGPFLYAFDARGRGYGRWRVRGARAVDWEDIAIGPGPVRGRWYLYIGDIGDNGRNRKEIVVYRVPEPKVAGPGDCQVGCDTGPATAIRLRYPDGPHNAEALLVHAATAEMYIVTKADSGDPETRVYRAPPRAGALAPVATLRVPEPFFIAMAGGITGGEISPDGRRVVLSDYFRAYEAAFDGDWMAEFRAIPIGFGLQVEGICYRPDGRAIMATSEGKPCPFIEVQSAP